MTDVRSLLGIVRVRHYEARDIDARLRLLLDTAYHTNLSDRVLGEQLAALRGEEEHALAHDQWSMRVFSIETSANGRLIGFCWIKDIDWVAGRCELSIGLLPEHRKGLGLVAQQATSAYLYEELGMEVTFHQVLRHNTMLLNSTRVEEFATLISPADHFTAGQMCDALGWTESREEFRALMRDREEKRARARARIARTR